MGKHTSKNQGKKNPKPETGFVLFDVIYEDGSLSSNRRVPAAELGGLDGDEPAKHIIEAQDSEIALKSGRPRGPIKTLKRSANQ